MLAGIFASKQVQSYRRIANAEYFDDSTVSTPKTLPDLVVALGGSCVKGYIEVVFGEGSRKT